METQRESTKVGVHREVLAERVWWYLTEWTGELPRRPDGKPVLRRRVVDDNGTVGIPELMVARWLEGDDVYSAWFDRWWGSRWRQAVYDGTKTDGAATLPNWVSSIVEPVFGVLGHMDGVWDAMGVHRDGSVVFAEAKRRGGDTIRVSQHQFASIAKAVLGERVSFRIVEWSAAPPLDWRELGYETEREYREMRDIYLSDAEYVSRDYRWTSWDEDLATFVRNRMPESGEAWLRRHRLLLPRQHDRFFAAMDALRA